MMETKENDMMHYHWQLAINGSISMSFSPIVGSCYS